MENDQGSATVRLECAERFNWSTSVWRVDVGLAAGTKNSSKDLFKTELEKF